MKKISLGIANRLLLAALLPSKGSYVSLILTKGIRNKIDLTSHEIKEMNVRDSGGSSVRWDRSKESVKVIEFDDREEEIIIEACSPLREQSEKGELDIQFLDLYELFVVPYEGREKPK